jgi:hypothetical protein
MVVLMTETSPTIPDFIVHYARGTPFLSITSLEPDLRAKTLSQLSEQSAWGINRFSDTEYLARRCLTKKPLL